MLVCQTHLHRPKIFSVQVGKVEVLATQGHRIIDPLEILDSWVFQKRCFTKDLQKCGVKRVLRKRRQGGEVHWVTFLELNDGLVPAQTVAAGWHRDLTGIMEGLRLAELERSNAQGVPACFESSTKQSQMTRSAAPAVMGSVVADKKRASQSTSSKDAGRACK